MPQHHSKALLLAKQQYNDYIRSTQFGSTPLLTDTYNDYFYRDAGLTSTKRRFVLVSDVADDLALQETMGGESKFKLPSIAPHLPIELDDFSVRNRRLLATGDNEGDGVSGKQPQNEEYAQKESIFDRLVHADEHKFTPSDLVDPSAADLMSTTSFQQQRALPLPTQTIIDHDSKAFRGIGPDGKPSDSNIILGPDLDTITLSMPSIHAKYHFAGQRRAIAAQYDNTTKAIMANRRNRLPSLLRSFHLDRYLRYKSNDMDYIDPVGAGTRGTDGGGKQPQQQRFKQKTYSRQRHHKRLQSLVLRNALHQHTSHSKLLLYAPSRALEQLSFVSKFPRHLYTAQNTAVDGDVDNSASFLQSTRSFQRNSNKMKTLLYLNLNQHDSPLVLDSTVTPNMSPVPITNLSPFDVDATGQQPLQPTASSLRSTPNFIRASEPGKPRGAALRAAMTTHIAPGSHPLLPQAYQNLPFRASSKRVINLPHLLMEQKSIDLDQDTSSPSSSSLAAARRGTEKVSSNILDPTEPPITTPKDFAMDYRPDSRDLTHHISLLGESHWSTSSGLYKTNNYHSMGQKLLSHLSPQPFHTAFYHNERLRNVLNSLQYHTASGNELDLNSSLVAVNDTIGFYVENDFYQDFSTLQQFVQALNMVEAEYLSQPVSTKRSVIQRIQRMDLHDHEASQSVENTTGSSRGDFDGLGGNTSKVNPGLNISAIHNINATSPIGNSATSLRFMNPHFHENVLTKQETIRRTKHLLILHKTQQFLNDLFQIEPQHNPMLAPIAEDIFVYNHTHSTVANHSQTSGFDKLQNDLISSMIQFSPHNYASNDAPKSDSQFESKLDQFEDFFEPSRGILGVEQHDDDHNFTSSASSTAVSQRQHLPQQPHRTSITTSSNSNPPPFHPDHISTTSQELFSVLHHNSNTLSPQLHHQLVQSLGKSVYTSLTDIDFTQDVTSQPLHGALSSSTIGLPAPADTYHPVFEHAYEDGNAFIDPNTFSKWTHDVALHHSELFSTAITPSGPGRRENKAQSNFSNGNGRGRPWTKPPKTPTYNESLQQKQQKQQKYELKQQQRHQQMLDLQQAERQQIVSAPVVLDDIVFDTAMSANDNDGDDDDEKNGGELNQIVDEFEAMVHEAGDMDNQF